MGQAPDINLALLDGRQISLQKLQGQPVLITFWATTCATCKKEIPHLIKLYEELSPNGLEIIAIPMSYDPPNQVLLLTEKEKIPYPVALDINGDAAQAFGNVEVTPTSFLIDPNGSISHYVVGKIDMEKLRRKITEQLSAIEQSSHV